MGKQDVEIYKLSGNIKDKNSAVRMSVLADCVCCETICEKQKENELKKNLAEKVLNGEQKDSSITLQDILDNYIKKKRKYYFLLITGKKVSSFAYSFRGTINTRLLYLISQNVSNLYWKKELEKFTSRFRESWFRQVRNDIIDEYVNEFWSAKKILTDSDMVYLHGMGAKLEELSNIYSSLLEKAYRKDAGVPEVEEKKENPVIRKTEESKIPEVQEKRAFFSSKENKISLQCMTEYYLSTTEKSTEQTWNQYLSNSWKRFFPGIDLSDAIIDELNEMMRMAQYNNVRDKNTSSGFLRYIKALGVVIRNGNLQNIRSDSVVRSLVLNRTTAMAISLIDPEKADKKTQEDLLQDIFAYLSYINYVTNKAEEEDLTDSIDIYCENGRFNSEAIKKLASFSGLWKKSVLFMKEYLNNKNKAVATLNNRIDEMENSLAKANYDSLKKLVLILDRGGFGYQLGELYRFAHSMDDISIEKAKELVASFFDQLNNIGIKPVAAEKLNQVLDERDELYKASIPVYKEETEGVRVLSYPGWSIEESVVALPVYRIKEK